MYENPQRKAHPPKIDGFKSLRVGLYLSPTIIFHQLFSFKLICQIQRNVQHATIYITII